MSYLGATGVSGSVGVAGVLSDDLNKIKNIVKENYRNVKGFDFPKLEPFQELDEIRKFLNQIGIPNSEHFNYSLVLSTIRDIKIDNIINNG